MTTYYLYYNKDKVIDLKEHIKKYNYETPILGVHNPMLAKGAPILINVDGSYIKESDIPGLIYIKKRNRKDYNIFHWVRDHDGRIITKPDYK